MCNRFTRGLVSSQGRDVYEESVNVVVIGFWDFLWYRFTVLTHQEINRPHAVYRLFNEAGDLLYIGCSHDPKGKRMEHHRADRPWAKEIARVELEWYPNWSPAILAEYFAIVTEEPKYNLKHTLDVGTRWGCNSKT
jgi:hypothetical protein